MSAAQHGATPPPAVPLLDDSTSSGDNVELPSYELDSPSDVVSTASPRSSASIAVSPSPLELSDDADVPEVIVGFVASSVVPVSSDVVLPVLVEVEAARSSAPI